MEEKKKGSVWSDILPLAIGEIIVSLAVIGVYLIIQACMPDSEIFTYKVITGVLLGSTVILVNYAALSISLSIAVKGFLEARGNGEMTDEEAADFANKNSAKIHGTVTVSYIIRTLSTVAALVVALLVPVFDVIPTVIPLLMFKPIIYITELINSKRKKVKK